MDPSELEQRLLSRFNLRVDPEMGRYVARQLAEGDGQALPIIGGEARTGRPLRLMIDPARLRTDGESRGATAS